MSVNDSIDLSQCCVAPPQPASVTWESANLKPASSASLTKSRFSCHVGSNVFRFVEATLWLFTTGQKTPRSIAPPPLGRNGLVAVGFKQLKRSQFATVARSGGIRKRASVSPRKRRHGHDRGLVQGIDLNSDLRPA